MTMAGSGEHVDLERFLSVLEGVRTVPFSGEFRPDGSFPRPTRGPASTCCSAANSRTPSTAASSGRLACCPRIAPSTTRAWRASATASSCQMEYRIEALDGRVLWIRECSRATPQADGSVRVDGIVTDVTDQRESADAASEFEGAAQGDARTPRLRALRHRRLSLRLAVPRARAPVADFESIPMSSFLGRDPSTSDLQHEWMDAVHPADRTLVAEDVLAAQLAGLPGSVEYRIRDGQGRYPLAARPLALPARAGRSRRRGHRVRHHRRASRRRRA